MKTLLALVLCLLPLAAPALEVPPLKGRVNDTAGLLSLGSVTLLESLLKTHEDRSRLTREVTERLLGKVA